MKYFLFAFIVYVTISCKTNHKPEYDYLFEKNYIKSSQTYSKECERGIRQYLEASNFFGVDQRIEKIVELEVELDSIIYDNSSEYFYHKEFCVFIGVVVIKPLDDEVTLVILILEPNSGEMMYCSEFANEQLYIVPKFRFIHNLSLAFDNQCFDEEKFQLPKIDTAKYGYWMYAGIMNFRGTFSIYNQYEFTKDFYNTSWLFDSDGTLNIDTLKTNYKIENDYIILSANMDTFNIVSLSSKNIFLLDNERNLIYFKSNGR